MALDIAVGDYSVIVDDDNILDENYIQEAQKLLIDSKWGCLGSQGMLDKNLILPTWFNDFRDIIVLEFHSVQKIGFGVLVP